MSNQFTRMELILGSDAMEKLFSAHVIIFGIGGVGSFVAEALARAGIGAIDLVDSDTVNVTNINRQIIALHSTIDRKKVDVMCERILDINPRAKVNKHDIFFSEDNTQYFDFNKYSYIIDAIDTVSAKLTLIKICKMNGIPIISSMGTGNKLDPTQLTVADIYATSVCPLARVMRHELRKLGIESLKVVYSKEEPKRIVTDTDENSLKRAIPGSVSFVPSVAGLILAGEVVKDIINVR